MQQLTPSYKKHSYNFKISNMDVEFLDQFIAKNIAQTNSNQKDLVYWIKFHLKKGVFLKHNGNLHLQTACKVKKNNIVDFLVKAGADVNFRNPLGETAINLAIVQFGFRVRSRVPHVSVLVEKLVRQGASLSMQDNLGRSLLHQWAFDKRYIFTDYEFSQMILEHLLKYNASVDLVDIQGNTALMYAALHNRGLFVMLLETTSKPPPLSRNFILDQQNFAGETCAHLLVMQQRERRINCNGSDDDNDGKALKMLISKGVSLYLENNSGETVIDCIIKCRYGNDYNRRVIYEHTYQCMQAFLMGTHSRLGAKSHVRHLDDVALDIILRGIRNVLKSIELNSYCTVYVCAR